jgi:hypothetical protein
MVLSVGFQGRVHHYRVLFSPDTQTYSMEGHVETFATLPDLLHHASESGKLVTALAYPLVDDDDAYDEEDAAGGDDDHLGYSHTDAMPTDVSLLLQSLDRRGGKAHEFAGTLERCVATFPEHKLRSHLFALAHSHHIHSRTGRVHVCTSAQMHPQTATCTHTHTHAHTIQVPA